MHARSAAGELQGLVYFCAGVKTELSEELLVRSSNGRWVPQRWDGRLHIDGGAIIESPANDACMAQGADHGVKTR